MILAGGQGMRLRPYSTILPKPLVPIGDRPILELILRQLADGGFTHVDLCVGHLGGLIRAYFEETKTVPEGMTVDYHWERHPLGTAGAVTQIDRPSRSILVMNGDILTTLDYGQFFRFHEQSGAAMTIATHRRDVKLELGVIEATAGVVNGYTEKPTLRYEVSMGIYAYSPDAFDRIPKGRFDFPDLVLDLIAAEMPVNHFHFDGEWFDIGTPSEHERAAEAFQVSPQRFDTD